METAELKVKKQIDGWYGYIISNAAIYAACRANTERECVQELIDHMLDFEFEKGN